MLVERAHQACALTHSANGVTVGVVMRWGPPGQPDAEAGATLSARIGSSSASSPRRLPVSGSPSSWSTRSEATSIRAPGGRLPGLGRWLIALLALGALGLGMSVANAHGGTGRPARDLLVGAASAGLTLAALVTLLVLYPSDREATVAARDTTTGQLDGR